MTINKTDIGIGVTGNGIGIVVLVIHRVDRLTLDSVPGSNIVLIGINRSGSAPGIAADLPGISEPDGESIPF